SFSLHFSVNATSPTESSTLSLHDALPICKGLEGATPLEILDLPSDFVTRIIGTELVRVRSQTTYYVLTRIKGICKVYLDRQRMRSEEHTSELQSLRHLVCRLLLEKKKKSI